MGAQGAVISAAFEACVESLAVIENGRVLYANPSFARAFGYFRAADVLGRPAGEFIPALAETSTEFPSANGRHRDGHRIDVQSSCAGFELNHRHFQVVSARPPARQTDAAVPRDAATMEALGRLVGGVAHDFNNLLTGILLYCDLLISELRQQERLRKHVEEMRAAAEQGGTLIGQLLDVARKKAEEPRLLCWNEGISALQPLLQRLLHENIRLLTELAPEPGTVKLDPAGMQQIILNLVLNARDAMPDGGTLTLITRRSGSEVEFVVADTGYGMNRETRSRLFEPFFTTKQPGRGTGLGLATVQRLVQEQAGRIQVDSETRKGTRVTVRLPEAVPVRDSIVKTRKGDTK